MNYIAVHDRLINRALSRTKSIDFESHHILPKCEGGPETGLQVFLTQKEHRVIHLLRYKITGVIGNMLAHRLMKFGRASLSQNHSQISKRGGQQVHAKSKLQDLEKYTLDQSKRGKIGGEKCKREFLGFFALDEKTLSESRLKGTFTIVSNKLGMFRDDFRETHRLTLMKSVSTPDGVFDSVNAAALWYNVVPATILYRIKNNSEKWSNWNYLTKGEK